MTCLYPPGPDPGSPPLPQRLFHCGPRISQALQSLCQVRPRPKVCSPSPESLPYSPAGRGSPGSNTAREGGLSSLPRHLPSPHLWCEGQPYSRQRLAP